ncbi:anti-sigma factor [Kocuria sediminis]|uniref:Anti-sigma factor n=1 Tax=Kocuria sediminis TaxID=1038857 RepID=A0A6N8GNU2_9MICC|nr:anti-sigma factor [Kocuria sediminis]MUN64568.1 anti-sigma factor [Kocuria sediminis]
MAHLSEESLALLALGEAGDAQAQEHLAACPECATELEALQHVVQAARARPPAPAAPGPEVWAAIHAELGLSDAVAADPLAGSRAGGRQRAEDDAAGGGDPAPADDDGGRGGATVVDLAARRRRGVPYPLAAAAAAAALLVGGLSVWGAQRLGLEPEPTVLATAELEPLAGYTARGSAEVDERPDGTRQLVVRTDPADVEGFKEVWLLAPDAQRMVSLGVMAGDEAVFVLPANLDVGEFPVVDVSNEPIDGDPTHSGDSIVRGTLQA